MWSFVELIPVRMRLFGDKYCPLLCTTVVCTKETRMIWIFIDRALLASAVSEASFCTWAISISIKIFLSSFLLSPQLVILVFFGQLLAEFLHFSSSFDLFLNDLTLTTLLLFFPSNFASRFLVSGVFNKNFVVINTPRGLDLYLNIYIIFFSTADILSQNWSDKRGRSSCSGLLSVCNSLTVSACNFYVLCTAAMTERRYPALLKSIEAYARLSLLWLWNCSRWNCE